MISLDEGQQVLHWRDAAWHRIAWQSWMSFRALNADFAPLPDVTAGEHRFVVCIVEDGRLFNILPHRYLIDPDGRIADDRYFGVLSDTEIERYEALNKRHHEYPQAQPLTKAEQTEFDAIRRSPLALMVAAGRSRSRIDARGCRAARRERRGLERIGGLRHLARRVRKTLLKARFLRSVSK